MSLEPLKKKSVVITRYNDRKMYLQGRSKYVNLDDIAAILREGRDVTIQECGSRKDITDIILWDVLFSCMKKELSIDDLRIILKNYGSFGKLLECGAKSK